MLDTTKCLLEFSACTGVAGREGAAVEYAKELLHPYGKVEITPLGSLLCRVREPREGEPHLLLDAHIDEIGLIVTYVEDSGFLRVSSCGGIDRRLLLASLVTVHGGQGDLSGVVCSVPPHLSDNDGAKNKKVEEIYIDIGLDTQSARERVRPGDVITMKSASRRLLGDLVSGKAMDDRAGCVSLLCALEQLKGQALGCGLTVLFSSMEEVGGQGAKTAAYAVSPTHAIAVDVGFGHTPEVPRERSGELKKGPMIGFAPILSRRMSQELVQLADKEEIPWQSDVMGGRTSTNADQLAVAHGGVVTGLVSIPQKYMHTPIETVAVEDVENTGRLLAAYAKYLGEEKQ